MRSACRSSGFGTPTLRSKNHVGKLEKLLHGRKGSGKSSRAHVPSTSSSHLALPKEEKKMIDECLNTYRQERRAFIAGLKHYFEIDFYKLDRRERTEWLRTYIDSKRQFFETLLEYWEDFPPELVSAFPEGYKKGGKKNANRSKRSGRTL